MRFVGIFIRKDGDSNRIRFAGSRSATSRRGNDRRGGTAAREPVRGGFVGCRIAGRGLSRGCGRGCRYPAANGAGSGWCPSVARKGIVAVGSGTPRSWWWDSRVRSAVGAPTDPKKEWKSEAKAGSGEPMIRLWGHVPASCIVQNRLVPPSLGVRKSPIFRTCT